MQPELRLEVNERGAGGVREFAVDSKRFTIGRSPDNDLVIEDSSLSRRHALIESFDGVIEISDCGSRNGTKVNSVMVAGPTVLNDGDRITLSDSTEITVRIYAGREAARATSSGTTSGAVRKSGRVQKTIGAKVKKSSAVFSKLASARAARNAPGAEEESPGFLSVPVIAAVSIVVIILFTLALIIFTHGRTPESVRTNRRPGQTSGENRPGQSQAEDNQSQQSSSSDSDTGNDNVSTSSNNASSEQVEDAAGQVMHRISSDERAYSFSEKALHDISQKVEEYRTSPSIHDALLAMQRGGSAVAAQARHEGLEPGLVVYTGLLMTDGGRSGRDPVTAAREMIPNLLALRATFGSGDADSSLLVLAAYKEGGIGTKQSHPLLEKMRRIVKNPLVERNIWYLHDHGGLSDDSYNFVVRFIALGVIAQNPRQFGVAADPLTF